MRCEREILEIMEMMRPHLQRIVKDADGMSLQIGMAADGRGWAVLYEYDRDMEHQHCVDLDANSVAHCWHVNHSYLDTVPQQYHQEIDTLTEECRCYA